MAQSAEALSINIRVHPDAFKPPDNRPLTARLQIPKVANQAECIIASFDEQKEFNEKVSKDEKVSHFGDYQEGIGLSREKKQDIGKYERVKASGLDARMSDESVPKVRFFKKLGRDMAFTFTSPRRGVSEAGPTPLHSLSSVLSLKSSVRKESSFTEAELTKNELMDEIAHFERTHLASRIDLTDRPDSERTTKTFEELKQTRTATQEDLGSKGSQVDNSSSPFSRSVSVLSMLSLSRPTTQIDIFDKRATTGAAGHVGRGDCHDGQGSEARLTKMSLVKLPFSPSSHNSPRSPRAIEMSRKARRDLPGTWDAHHPCAVDHESPAYKSGALTDRGFSHAEMIRNGTLKKHDPLNTHRGHGFEVGTNKSRIDDVTAWGRKMQWKRQYGESTFQGGRWAAIAPFYRSWDVYSSGNFKRDKAIVQAALDRRELLEEPASGMGLDPCPNAPVGPLHGRRRIWNFRYNMTYEESISRSFKLNTNPTTEVPFTTGTSSVDTKTWKSSVERPMIDLNQPPAWISPVSGDKSLEGSRRNCTLPVGHCGDFRSTLVKQSDGTVQHRPISPRTQHKVQTSLTVKSNKDYIVDHRYYDKGGMYYTDEPALPKSPSSPGPWNPPKRDPGAGWTQGVMAKCNVMPANRDQLPGKFCEPRGSFEGTTTLPPWKSVAWLMSNHDHRGLDDDAVAVQWQPYKTDRGPTHAACRWDQYMNPPGMAFLSKPYKKPYEPKSELKMSTTLADHAHTDSTTFVRTPQCRTQDRVLRNNLSTDTLEGLHGLDLIPPPHEMVREQCKDPASPKRIIFGETMSKTIST